MSQTIQLDGPGRGPRPVLPLLLSRALLGAPRASPAAVAVVAPGRGGNAVLRGPWVTSGWRKPLPRLALFVLGSLVYERFVDHSGWSWSDFNQRFASYVLAEAAVSGVRRIERKRVGAPSSVAPLRIRGDPWCLREPRRAPLQIVPWPIAADRTCGRPLRRV